MKKERKSTFPKDLNKEGGAPSNSKPPCWYIFWAGTAVTEYDTTSGTYSYANGGANDYAQYNGDPQNPHYIIRGPASAGHEQYNCTKGTFTLNVDRKGIDTCTATLKHEKQHRQTDLDWLPGGVWAGQTDTDGDELPDDWENDPVHVAQGFDANNANSFAGTGFPYGDDEEVWCEIQASGATGVANKDWSKSTDCSKQW